MCPFLKKTFIPSLSGTGPTGSYIHALIFSAGDVHSVPVIIALSEIPDTESEYMYNLHILL
jgi:hypothetical protein